MNEAKIRNEGANPEAPAPANRMSGFRLYWRYLGMNLKSGLQYKGWPLQLFNCLLVVVTDPIGTLFLFRRFGGIGPWSMERMLLVYALAVTCFGLAESFSRGFDVFPWHIRSGNFDRMLLRPRPAFLSVLGSRFDIHRLARVVSGFVVIGWCLHRLGVVMTAGRAAMLLLALLGGYLAYTGVFVLTSGIAFFTIAALDWIYIFTNASYQVTRCPPELLPRWLYGVFTFLMPMLVVSYYPAAALCGWGEPAWVGWLAFPAGAAFLLIALPVWRFGVRHYRSTGS